MRVLKHKEDLSNYLRACISLLILLLPAYTGLPDGAYAVVYGVIIWFLLSDMNFLLHQHVHTPLTTSRRQNVVLDWIMSFVTGMCAYNWRGYRLKNSSEEYLTP